MYCISPIFWHEELDNSLTVNVVKMPNVLSHNPHNHIQIYDWNIYIWWLVVVLLFNVSLILLCLYVNIWALRFECRCLFFASIIILFIHMWIFNFIKLPYGQHYSWCEYVLQCSAIFKCKMKYIHGKTFCDFCFAIVE